MVVLIALLAVVLVAVVVVVVVAVVDVEFDVVALVVRVFAVCAPGEREARCEGGGQWRGGA